MRNLNTKKITIILVILVITWFLIQNFTQAIEIEKSKHELIQKEMELIEAKKPSSVEIIRLDLIKYVNLRQDLIKEEEIIDHEIYLLQIEKEATNTFREISEYKIRCNRFKIWQAFDIDCEEDYINYPAK